MSLFDDDEVLQTTKTLKKPISLKRESKIKMIQALKKEVLKDVFKELPKINESIHIVSNGKFDYFNFIPLIIQYIGDSCDFYGSTWTMNRGNVNELLELFDTNKIKSISILTGLYFKQRESSVYATLVEGIQERKQKYLCLENHSKIILLTDNKDNYIVVEGSANFTANPRIEQNTITNSKELYFFHKEWIDKIIKDA